VVFLDAAGVFLPAVVGALAAVERLLLVVLSAVLEAVGLLLVLDAGFGLAGFFEPAFGAAAGLPGCFPVAFAVVLGVAAFLAGDAVDLVIRVLEEATGVAVFTAVGFFVEVFVLVREVAVFLAVDFCACVFEVVAGATAAFATFFFTRVFLLD
jgi:hypothetical protein